jgi:aminoacrylate hydrolase
MQHASIGDADIYYEIVGGGEPVLLVAGLGGAATYWQPNVKAFAQRHQVVLHDHRGTGLSSHSEIPYSVELMAADLLRLMDALQIERAHLVGHSTGGAIGQVLAATAPDRIASLVLYASWATLDAQMERCLSLRRTLLMTAGIAEYHRATPIFLYPPTFICEHDKRLALEADAAAAGSSSVSILESRIRGIMDFDGLQYLDRIQCPTLVLVAEDDILTPPASSELLAQRITGAQLVRAPRGAHGLSRSDPLFFNSAVLAFLAQHTMQHKAEP